MASVLDRPTDTVETRRAGEPTGRPPRTPRRPRRHSASAARWLAVLVLGFMVGAALVLLTDSDPSRPTVSATPAGGSGTSGADPSSASSKGGVTDVNGQHVHGVKAADVAAESQPDEPLDAPTRELLARQLTT